MVSEQNFLITIGRSNAGLRLDQLLSVSLNSVSRSRISMSVRKGLISVDGVTRKSSYRLKVGETVKGGIYQPGIIDLLPEKIDFKIIFEDDGLLVLSKPPGLVVHPGSGNHDGTLVNGLIYHCQQISGVGEKLRPGIVHRLDKDTSGIMVVAKSVLVLRKLVESFKNRTVEKSYIALLHGTMKEKTGRIVAPIGRHTINRQKMAVRHGVGRHAVSSWQVLAEFEGRFSLVKVGIETGRTHQIRVHMAYLGHPVAGDSVYGGSRNNDGYPRQLLHAHSLVLSHPVTGTALDLTAPLWPDFVMALQQLEWTQIKGLL